MSEKDKKGYNVVFEGVGGKKSNVRGVRTWTTFDNKSHLSDWLDETKIRDRIVAEGVPKQLAIELCAQTPATAFLEFAIREATIDGVLDEKILTMKLATIRAVHTGKIDNHRLSN